MLRTTVSDLKSSCTFASLSIIKIARVDTWCNCAACNVTSCVLDLSFLLFATDREKLMQNLKNLKVWKIEREARILFSCRRELDLEFWGNNRLWDYKFCGLSLWANNVTRQCTMHINDSLKIKENEHEKFRWMLIPIILKLKHWLKTFVKILTIQRVRLESANCI